MIVKTGLCICRADEQRELFLQSSLLKLNEVVFILRICLGNDFLKLEKLLVKTGELILSGGNIHTGQQIDQRNRRGIGIKENRILRNTGQYNISKLRSCSCKFIGEAENLYILFVVKMPGQINGQLDVREIGKENQEIIRTHLCHIVEERRNIVSLSIEVMQEYPAPQYS